MTYDVINIQTTSQFDTEVAYLEIVLERSLGTSIAAACVPDLLCIHCYNFSAYHEVEAYHIIFAQCPHIEHLMR